MHANDMKIIKYKSKQYELESRCLSHSWELDDFIYLTDEPDCNILDNVYELALDELREVNKENIENFKKWETLWQKGKQMKND